MEEISSSNVSSEIKQSNRTLYIAIAVVAVLVLAFFTNGFGLINRGNGNGGTGNVIENPTLEIGHSPVLGNPDAKVTIYEFSDFSCPFCSKFALETAPQLEKKFVSSGDVKIVFKYFPGHGAGKAAMIVGYALTDQSDELFWKFHDLAFQNQADTGDLVKMKALAEQVGADITKLNADIASGKYNSYLNEDEQMGKDNSITGTPSFVIGNQVIVGAQPLDVFVKAINAKL